MSAKSLKIVNVLVWGGAGLLLAGIAVSYLGLAPQIGALFPVSDVPAVVTVIVTPTPKAGAPLLPFQAEASAGSEATPATVMTYVAYTHPEDADPVITYTLPEIGVAPVRIRIPDINLEAPVIPIGWRNVEVGGQVQPMWDVPTQRVAGWHETSAKVGAGGNTVLNGHNTSNGEVFRYLYKLDVGATILLEAEDGATYTYTVTEKLILPEIGQPLEVRIQNAQYILPTADERLTLVTCHPYGSLANRLLIIAHPAAPPTSGSTEGD